MKNYLKNKILESPSKMISYAAFIQEALYHPTLGYYMKEREKVGRFGDFITTSNVSDIYGKIVARWFSKLVDEKGIPATVCEIGGGNGRFANAFIEGWKELSTEKLQYYILEESPYHRKLQLETIQFDENIRQISSLEELKPFHGLIFSNELFDALPVHVIEKRNNQIMEVMVSFNGDRFVEGFVPLEDDSIQSFLEDSGLVLQLNQRIEIPLSMVEFVKKIADVIERGLILTVDYGYTNEEWMEPSHQDGSLRGYYQHGQVNDVLKNPGEIDITSHVHFDSFIQIGEEHGLRLHKKVRQDEFFLSIGLLEQLLEHSDPNPFSKVSRRNRAIRSLIMPNGMSSYFHVIIQSKGLDGRF